MVKPPESARTVDMFSTACSSTGDPSMCGPSRPREGATYSVLRSCSFSLGKTESARANGGE